MRNISSIVFLALISLTIMSCIDQEKLAKFQEQAIEGQTKISDQQFKTAIALIELHKVRTGSYPESLDSLKFLGEFDKMIYQSVKYEKVEDGYYLSIVNRPNDSLTLNYPDEFWNGLGIKGSNVGSRMVKDHQ